MGPEPEFVGQTWSSCLASIRASEPYLWDQISVDIYAIFWTLAIDDIYVPSQR